MRLLNRYLYDHVSGHFPIDGRGCYASGGRFFTLVREPVARELSNYNFHYQRGFLSADTDLLGLYRQGQLLDNPQTRLLAGADAMRGACDKVTLARAQANLSGGDALAAPVEEADSLLRVLLAANGWPAVLYRHSQITAEKLVTQPDAATAGALAEIHAFDAELYRWVAARWHAWLAEAGAREPALGDGDPIVSCCEPGQGKHRFRWLRMRDVPADSVTVTLASPGCPGASGAANGDAAAVRNVSPREGT